MSRLTHSWPIKAGRSSWLIAAAIVVALLVAFGFVDATMSRLGQGLPEQIITIFRWITRLGESDYILISSGIAFLVCGALVLALRDGRWKPAMRQLAGLGGFVFVGVGLPGLLTAIIKRLIGRPRPEYLETLGPFDFRAMSWLDWTYQSFPSGHTTTAFALCFTVSFLVPRGFPWMLMLAVLIAVSRIIVGAHYPTDVLGGAVVGTLGAYGVRNVFAARGWVFERRPDGAVGLKPFSAIADAFAPR